MGAFDVAAAARAKMAQVQREMAERRALRDRNFQQRRAEALDAFKKQGPVMEQVAKHMGELGRRRKQAGGWATEKTEKDKDFVMGGFGFEDEEPAKNPYEFQASRRTADTPPGGIGTLEDEESPLQSSAPMPSPAPEAPPAPEPPAPPRAPRRPVAPRQDLDDEDDFSNQSSWMQNR